MTNDSEQMTHTAHVIDGRGPYHTRTKLRPLHVWQAEDGSLYDAQTGRCLTAGNKTHMEPDTLRRITRDSASTMTKAEALSIQRVQCQHYEQISPGITAKVQAATNADALEDGREYPIHEINKWVPRGGTIEYMMGKR